MKTFVLCAAGGAIALVAAAGALARPINGAVVNTRIFNDDSNSTVTATNLYPASITIRDDHLDGDGVGGEFANRHNFRLSSDGGATEAAFANNSAAFYFASDVTITGPANSEGGLNLSPWWSQEVDGVFMLNSGGEIAIFGGRLPFYSFTANGAPAYARGTTARLGMAYDPHSVSSSDPATIQYFLSIGGSSFASPVLAFDEGNAAEGHGTFGMLDDARLGGYFQPQIQVGNPANFSQIVYGNITYVVPAPAGLSLLGLAGLVAIRRRR
jgi:hypothetical protein